MPEKKCLTCTFRIIGENKGGARCHRFPPTGYNPGTARAIFPVIQDDDICGEWATTNPARVQVNTTQTARKK